MKARIAQGLVLAVVLAVACKSQLTHFDHRAHLAERPCGGADQPQCLNCTSCHVGEAAAHDHFVPPGASTCSGCHRDAEAKWAHAVRPAVAAPLAGKSIVFSHDQHLGQPELKGQCIACHAGAVGVQSGPPLFPKMEKCLGCHQHREEFDRGSCLGCHRSADPRTLRPVSFLSHDTAWVRRHGDAARTDASTCALCHAQTQCDSCHDSSRQLGPAQRSPERIEGSFVHRFDFLSRHALESQSQPGSCATCHARTECDACHASRGVSAAVRGAQSPHPPGWASGLSSNTHGPAARRDIASCAACHDQGPSSNCVTCHRVGAYGGTPHPTGWRSSEPVTAPQCAACHRGTP